MSPVSAHHAPEYRVNKPGYTNITAGGEDTDAELDIYEALIDPHEGGKSGRGGPPGAPMMMPPMMAGPGAGAGATGGGAAGVAGAASLVREARRGCPLPLGARWRVPVGSVARGSRMRGGDPVAWTARARLAREPAAHPV